MNKILYAVIQKLNNLFGKKVPELSQGNFDKDAKDTSTQEPSTDLPTEYAKDTSTQEPSTDLPTEYAKDTSTQELSTDSPTEHVNDTSISDESTNISKIWGPEDDIELNETIRRYGSTLSNLLDDSTLQACLPYANEKSLSLYKGIINYLESEKQNWNESDPDECKEINRLEEIIGICQKKVEQIISSTVRQSTEESNDEPIKLIFATTPANRVCFINDLGSIDKTYDKYGNIEPLLLGIKDYRSFARNGQKYKIFKSNNKNIFKGIREAKDYQIRIFFKPLKAGSKEKCVYIYGIFIKKDDISAYIEEALSYRIQAQQKEYTTILSLLKSNDENGISELYARHAQIEQEIIDILNFKRRGEENDEQQAAQ